MSISLPSRRVLSFLVLLAALAAWADAALAERADRDKPMGAEADSLRYDDARQTSVFSGNVVITKGTILIRGAQVEVRQDPQGHQFGVVTGSPGFFRQKREGLDEYIEGQAARIEYDSQSETVKFTGEAVLRRYRGTQLSDETTGGVIVYNGANDTFSVDGSPGNRSAAGSSGRVRAMLTPVPRPDAPATPGATAVPLKPSGQLGEGRP
ncbi:MAG: lipopolysaccharide transport periplasmic protein LptA [Hydrogenophaga sp.]